MNAETTPRLGTLPVAFPAVAALHRVAEQVIAPARKPEGEIALTATPGTALAAAGAHDGPAMVEVITDPNVVRQGSP